RADALPRASEVARDLEMDLPAVVLGARRAKERSVLEKDRLVANGAEDRLGESTRLGPRRSRVSRLREHSPPGARAGPDLVEEEEALRVDRVEDRVPARVAKVLVLDPVRDLDGRARLSTLDSRQPDSDVRVTFARAGEERDEDAALGLDERRRVALIERCRDEEIANREHTRPAMGRGVRGRGGRGGFFAGHGRWKGDARENENDGARGEDPSRESVRRELESIVHGEPCDGRGCAREGTRTPALAPGSCEYPRAGSEGEGGLETFPVLTRRACRLESCAAEPVLHNR